MPFKFNPISGQFDLVNPASSPGGSDGQIQYNNSGAFGGASAAGYDDTANRVNIGDQTGSYSFFPTNDTKLQVTNLVTSIGTSFSPLDIIKLLDSTSVTVNPSADTNSGLGITIYAAKGYNLRTDGNKKFNGGLPIGITQLSTSLIGSFGQTNYYSTAGSTLDTAMGILCNSTHGGYGGAADTLVGGTFTATTTDDAGGGTATGSLALAIGGIFTAGIEDNGVSITSAIAGKFIEPLVLGGSGTITNKTAAWIDGTYSITRSTVASAASITNMAAATSFIEITGSTTTSLHGILSDAFAKEIIVYNATNTTVTLKNQSGSASAANRIITTTGGDLIIPSGKTVRLYYNLSVSRWLVDGALSFVVGSDKQIIWNNAGILTGTAGLEYDSTLLRTSLGEKALLSKSTAADPGYYIQLPAAGGEKKNWSMRASPEPSSNSSFHFSADFDNFNNGVSAISLYRDIVNIFGTDFPIITEIDFATTDPTDSAGMGRIELDGKVYPSMLADSSGTGGWLVTNILTLFPAFQPVDPSATETIGGILGGLYIFGATVTPEGLAVFVNNNVSYVAGLGVPTDSSTIPALTVTTMPLRIGVPDDTGFVVVPPNGTEHLQLGGVQGNSSGTDERGGKIGWYHGAATTGEVFQGSTFVNDEGWLNFSPNTDQTSPGERSHFNIDMINGDAILESPDGNHWRLKVSNAGVLSTTLV